MHVAIQALSLVTVVYRHASEKMKVLKNGHLKVSCQLLPRGIQNYFRPIAIGNTVINTDN